MNKKQKVLYKALEVLATATLNLESAVNCAEELSKEEVQEVINVISEKYMEYDSEMFYQEAYDYETYANNILSSIDVKLGIEEI